MSDIKIIYQEFDLSEIINYFIKGFKANITQHDYFIDQAKGKVIFKLYVEKDSGEGA